MDDVAAMLLSLLEWSERDVGKFGSMAVVSAMADAGPGDQIGSTVALGLLAENMVGVSARLLADRGLTARDRAALKSAQRFLLGLRDAADMPMPITSRRRLAPAAGGMALRAVRDVQLVDKAADHDSVSEYVTDLAELLQRATDDKLLGPDRHRFAIVMRLFETLGELLLRRTDEYTLARLSSGVVSVH